MNAYPNVILGDMSAIREKGIEYYQDNFFWPVPDKEYNDFISFIHNTYIDLILDLDNEYIFDIALVEYSFLVTVLEGVFHYNYVKQFSQQHDISLISGEDSYHYLNPDWDNHATYYSRLDFPFGKMKRYFRRIVRNILFNRHLPILTLFKSFFIKSQVVGIGSYDDLKKEFVEKNGYYCDHIDWVDLLRSEPIKECKNQNRWSRSLIENVVTPFLKSIQNHDSYFVKNIDFQLIHKTWATRFLMASGIYEKLLNIKKPKCLLVTETAKQHSKLFSTAFQKSDCKVYCFYHGNDTGLKIYKNRHRHVEAHCRYLVVPTKGIARELTKNYIDDKVDKRTGTEYVSVDSIFYENILRQSTRTKRASKVKKVMLLGTPANPNRYVHEHGQFFYIKVDLEYRLIKALKLGGYEVIYKAHPDRLEEVKGLFENVVDEYCTHPFEDVWQKADAFLFTDTASTTFGLSLPTNKHIVLMDNSIDQKNHHVEGLLNKRIRSVSMCLNESMRMKFNNNELYYALNNQFDTIDYSIINEVLL